jgi:N-acetylglutamate synthase-like GNAT family acetyltransferase
LILKLLINPKLILDIYKRFIVVEKRSEPSDKEESKSCELSSIAVLPDSNNKGYGRQLINSFIEESKKYNIKYIYLTTDVDNNDKVNKFYKNCGFIVSETFSIFNNRKMNKYKKYIN